MGKFKNVGEPSLVLMEEMAEAIQVIAKLHRFQGTWDQVPEGQDKTRWEMLQAEMADVFYQWFRLKDQVMGPSEIDLATLADQHEQEERERMMQSEDMYSSLWESNDPNAPDYEDTQDVEWPKNS